MSGYNLEPNAQYQMVTTKPYISNDKAYMANDLDYLSYDKQANNNFNQSSLNQYSNGYYDNNQFDRSFDRSFSGSNSVPGTSFVNHDLPPMKRYSVSYPMGYNLPVSYTGAVTSRTIPYTPVEQGPATAIPYISSVNNGQSSGWSGKSVTPVQRDNLYFGNYYYNGSNGSNGSNMVVKDDFINDLSPTVGFNSLRGKLDEPLEHQPIPLNLNSHTTQNGYGSKEIFEMFKERLASLKHVRLVRTNTLPKEEVGKNIRVVENNNSKLCFNFEYPTVSITFQQPINNVTLGWSDMEKTVRKRRLVLFYWDFSLMKAHHSFNRGEGQTSDLFNQDLEYVKSMLNLNYEIISEEEYQILFEDKHQELRSHMGDYRLQHLMSIVQKTEGSDAGKLKNNFCVISCLYWKHTDNYYLTSVELLFLLDKLSGRTTNITNSVSTKDVALMGSKSTKKNRFASKQLVKKYKNDAKLLKTIDSKEVNRIRRNLVNFNSVTLGKIEAEYAESFGISGTEEEMEFFHNIMSFCNPKPRKIEKKLKVYEWSILEKALDKIMKKYCVDLKNEELEEGLRESGYY